MIDAVAWLRERRAAGAPAPRQPEAVVNRVRVPGLRRPCGCQNDVIVFGHSCMEDEEL